MNRRAHFSFLPLSFFLLPGESPLFRSPGGEERGESFFPLLPRTLRKRSRPEYKRKSGIPWKENLTFQFFMLLYPETVAGGRAYPRESGFRGTMFFF